MLNRLVVRAPWTWPLLRGAMRGFYDRAAPGWDDRTRAGSVEHLAPLAAALLRVKPAPERALDVGTGTGEGALLIAREFPQAGVRGVDFSSEMIRSATGKVGLDPEGRIAFRVVDAADLPYEDESFDLVTHLNMPPFVAEVARILRPGGFVIVASSWGSATPFYTPRATLDWGFAKRGIEPAGAGEAGDGTYWVGRRPPAA
jgi:ubiquinone/menaquinone biosynthesis C-methylase UbiE